MEEKNVKHDAIKRKASLQAKMTFALARQHEKQPQPSEGAVIRGMQDAPSEQGANVIRGL